MSTKLKLYIGRRILDRINTASILTPVQIKPIIHVNPNSTCEGGEFIVPLVRLEQFLGVGSLDKVEPDEIIEKIYISSTKNAQKQLCFQINKNIFIKEIVEHCTQKDIPEIAQKIVVEFSSPNIAKPFHVGHLRSTIIGNFISNLHSYFQHNVVRLNYLGDWGTQIGYIKVGLQELQNSNSEIEQNPLKMLLNAYIHAHKLGEHDVEIHERAKKEFLKLESASPEDISTWKTFIKCTIKELTSMYDRLGIKFDEYHYESMYSSKNIQHIIQMLDKNNVLITLDDGKRVARVNDRNVSLIKSDGTCLYLTRDIAAAIDRFNKYTFDKMFYVVDNAQSDHFLALRSILTQLKYQWANNIQHVKFGRIRGMSTRKGNVVFLKDILDESRYLMMQRQLKSTTTKVPISDEKTSDILGISCVIINDLKQKRQRDYEFSWDRALQVQGDSGIKLQYTHCRLCNLEKNCGVLAAGYCQPEFLIEPEALQLVKQLARFGDVLQEAHQQLEACILLEYLFHLCNHISKALKVLKVKDQEKMLAAQRLLLFNNAREVLRQGMVIVGLQPLTNM